MTRIRTYYLGGTLALALFGSAGAAGDSPARDGAEPLALFEWGAAPYPDVTPQLLYSVALRESRYFVDGKAQPWPWVLNSQRHGARFYPTRGEAEEALLALLEDEPGANVDVGLMQVSWRWNGHRVDHPAELLDPHVSVRVGAEILAEARASTDEVLLGVGRYHHWRDPWVARRYGAEVYRIQYRLPEEYRDETKQREHASSSAGRNP